MLSYKIYHEGYCTAVNIQLQTMMANICSMLFVTRNPPRGHPQAIALPLRHMHQRIYLDYFRPAPSSSANDLLQEAQGGGERQRRGGNICPRELPGKSRR
ncbi:hypothetical protein CDAR_415061 [Caerostris darwini]|uniref:Uncharacterized protein n=1 Tax=Caerostris darwini TaxID=1538125 RepID=A0AAV4TH37_9ARAC|nr:hypothetical protein CDAR_415061 [Caerostris darwini]